MDLSGSATPKYGSIVFSQDGAVTSSRPHAEVLFARQLSHNRLILSEQRLIRLAKHNKYIKINDL
jgi:hypothetical protein